MATQMTSARRGVATDEMKQIAKDEDVTLDWLIPKIASGSIIIPSNNVRKEKIHNVAIGKGTKTKVNVNIGTSTLNVNIEEEIEIAVSDEDKFIDIDGGAEEEDAARGHLPRDEVAELLREAIGEESARKGRGGSPRPQVGSQTGTARALGRAPEPMTNRPPSGRLF